MLPAARRVAALVLLALAATAGSPRAAAAPPEPNTPEERFRAAARALPAPGPGLAFEVRGEARVEGRPAGAFLLAARPLEAAGSDPARWRVEERVEVRGEDEEGEAALLRRAATAVLAADLSPRSGTLESTDALGERSQEWNATDTGFAVRFRGESQEMMERKAPSEGPCTTGFAALLLFARGLRPATGEYATRVFDPDWDHLLAERPFESATFQIEREGGPPGEAAFVVAGKVGDATFRARLAAGTGELLGMDLGIPGWPALALVPGGGADGSAADLPADVFTTPAKTPLACALRVALAFATADVDLFAATIHWPTLREESKDLVRGKVSDEAFRTSIRGQFERAKQEAQPRAEAEASLRAMADRCAVAPEGEARAVVTLPEEYAGMRLTLVRVAEVWYLARLPGR